MGRGYDSTEMASPERLSKFRVIERLGSGAFATVWLAEDEDLQSRVAVKVLADIWSYDDDIRRRFLQEARELRRLGSDRIVQVFEVGQLADGRPYMVMDYLDGGTLEDRMKQRFAEGNRFEIAEAVDLGLQIAHCLASVHMSQIVHRDIKPSNVLFKNVSDAEKELARHRGERVIPRRMLLGDFGIARRLEGTRRATMVVGTPHYVAPEQADPETANLADYRSDIYSASVMLYELLAGQVPWPYDSFTQVLKAQQEQAITRISMLRSDVPIALEEALNKGLERDPTRRFATALEWGDALNAAIEPRQKSPASSRSKAPQTVIPPGSRRDLGSAPPDAYQDAWRHAEISEPKAPPVAREPDQPPWEARSPAPIIERERSSDRRFLLMALAAVLVLAISVAGAFLFLKTNEQTPSNESASDRSSGRKDAQGGGGQQNGTPFTNSSLIAFSSDRAGSEDIFTMTVRGTQQERLTTSAGDDSRPTWSPNGRKILFTSDRAGTADIFVITANGTREGRLTETRGSEFKPDWSPNGKLIVFGSAEGGCCDLYVMQPSGRGINKLTATDDVDEGEPDWSQDGSSIAFTSTEAGNEDIYSMNPNGTGIRALTRHPAADRQPAWSPDGTKIAFSSERDGDAEIYLLNLDGSRLTRLTENAREDARPTWSPDGSMIAFVSDRDGDEEIFTMRANGTDVVQITHNEAVDGFPVWSSTS